MKGVMFTTARVFINTLYLQCRCGQISSDARHSQIDDLMKQIDRLVSYCERSFRVAAWQPGTTLIGCHTKCFIIMEAGVNEVMKWFLLSAQKPFTHTIGAGFSWDSPPLAGIVRLSGQGLGRFVRGMLRADGPGVSRCPLGVCARDGSCPDAD